MSNIAERILVANAELATNITTNSDEPKYRSQRDKLVTDERINAWDAKARKRASEAEREAQQIIIKIREHERTDPNLFGDVPGEAVPAKSTRDMGGRFINNLPRIRQSRIFKMAQQMPKGSHQHLHFNSEIPPERLFPYARRPEMESTMFIRSTQPLLSKEDADETEIVFNVLPKETPRADIFSREYNPDWRNKANSPWMRWVDFRKRIPGFIECKFRVDDLDTAENWAREKMVITLGPGEADTATHNVAWACFNQGTRAFKGLVGYEGIYRWYIGHAIESMIADKVMYAELRPMLLDKTIPSDDGTQHLNHQAQMQIIVEEMDKKRAELEAEGQLDKFPFGLKIIYCTPRSIPRERMKSELDDCLRLKLQFPDLICGFDLVGAEDRPNCISFYADLLLAFTKTCKTLGVKVPFMFHAGETLLDSGGSSNPENSNLYDSLLLNAKRIGHGYALLKHPMLIEKYKKADICLELCPISNELLRLCGNAREHPYPALLAAGLPCTLNADNPSLFRSVFLTPFPHVLVPGPLSRAISYVSGPTIKYANRGAYADFSSSLAHEFYQVMVGDPRMSLHGWKQLAEWSLDYSCLDREDKARAREIYAHEWEIFCQWIVSEYKAFADGLMDVGS